VKADIERLEYQKLNVVDIQSYLPKKKDNVDLINKLCKESTTEIKTWVE